MSVFTFIDDFVEKNLFKAFYSAWPQNFGLNLYEFGVEICLLGKKYYGRGFSENKDMAIVIATMEAVERFVSYTNGLANTNGVAIHFDYEVAKKNSSDELCERHIFLYQFENKISFNKVDYNVKKYLGSKILNFFINNGIEIQIYCSKLSIDSKYVYLSVINGENSKFKFGNIVGLSFGQFEDSVVQKSINESLSLFFNYFYENFQHRLNMSTFSKKESLSFSDHGLLSLDLDYANDIRFLFDLNNESESIRLHNFEYSEIKQTRLNISESVTSLMGVAAYKAYSEKFSELYLGSSPRNCLNTLPHPLA